MSIIEKTLTDLLIDLKNNHNAIGIKAEFEDEGASIEEITTIKKIAENAEIGLTIKIGGCGALNDINQSKILNAVSIVAPMVESSYALKKFINTIDSTYTNEEKKPNLFINIETINGYKNFDSISETCEFKKLTGIVVGRFDLAKSIDLECKDCNGEKIFKLVQELAIKTSKTGKLFTVGGGVNQDSLLFFEKISNYINMFETRKIIFDADFAIKSNDITGILKAINFELLWLELKKEIYGFSNEKDIRRLNILNLRLKKSELVSAK